MITRSLFVVVAILLFASPAFTQFGQSNNSRLTDLAARLSRESGDFADQNYSTYTNSVRNNRTEIEAVMLTQQFAASAQIFYRMVVDRRRNQELRDAFDLLSIHARTVERNNLQRNSWFNIQRLISDIAREVSYDSSDGGGQNPDPGRGGWYDVARSCGRRRANQNSRRLCGCRDDRRHALRRWPAQLHQFTA